MPVTTISWEHDQIKMIDQTLLPHELKYLIIDNIPTLCEAIRNLRVRGAPAIGVAAAFGVCLSAQKHKHAKTVDVFIKNVFSDIETLRATRPTAVNLPWALDRMKAVISAEQAGSNETIYNALVNEANAILQSDREINRKLAEIGNEIIPNHAQIITHCNTGALATADYGTALGCIFTAHSHKKELHIWVDETRPLLQGARLNMWELLQEGIDATLICDNTAAFVMQKFSIDLCIVGADRIAANGDTANKIGTYALALAAKFHKVPFYIAAPTSTFDLSIKEGNNIPIEERSHTEVTGFQHINVAPNGANAFAPAFDITPANLISGIITERGIIRPPYLSHIAVTLKNA